MARTATDRSTLLARARRLRGQVEAVERSLGGEFECAEVLQQLAAIRGAANGLMASVLEGHMRDHMGAQRSRDTDALLEVLRRYLR